MKEEKIIIINSFIHSFFLGIKYFGVYIFISLRFLK